MYKNFFNLKGKPFGLNPEPKYFFNSTTHKQAFQCIGSGLEEGQGFITITGDAGSGKTTLVSGLLHMLAQTDVITGCLHNPHLQSDDLLRYSIAEFGLPFQEYSKVALLKVLEDFFENCRQYHKRAVLIIDDAHNLSETAIEELKMMLNLFQGKKPVLQFILLGQFNLNDSNSSSLLKPLLQKIVASYCLTNLERMETKAYITHRLRIAGWKGDPEISTDAYTSIYDHTLGNPGEINRLCLRLLDAACCMTSHTIDSHLVQWVVQEVVHQRTDVDFSGTVLEALANKSYEEQSHQELGFDTAVIEFQNEEENDDVVYEIEDIEEKADSEKEADIKNWLTRKKESSDVSSEPSVEEPENPAVEEEELFGKLQSSNISQLFPDGTSEDDIEEIIY